LPDGSLQKPVAYLVCNYGKPVGDQPALLRHDDAVTLFHEFGHGLHHMLTRVEIGEVSGINGVAWDAVEFPSQMLENWCWQKESLPLISAHYQTGAPLPDELLTKMLEAKNYLAARALIRKAPVVLFDEPLASVDEELSASIRADIARLHAEYKFTGLYVTHDQNEALQLGQRVAVMDAGYLVQVDTPEHLLANPHTLQAARLTASPALNELSLTEGQHLPAGASLYVRATSLRRIESIAENPAENTIPVQVRSVLPQVGGTLYRAVTQAKVTLDAASHDGSARVPLQVSGGQPLEFFEPDALALPVLTSGERVQVQVPPHHCFIFADGTRHYL